MTNTEDLNAPAPTIPMPTVFYVQESTGDVYEHGTDGRVFLMEGGYLQKDGWAAGLGALKEYRPAKLPSKKMRPDMLVGIVLAAFFVPWMAVGLASSNDRYAPPLWWQIPTVVLITSIWAIIGYGLYRYFRDRAN